MVSIYPWFQDYNTGCPWIISGLFHHLDCEGDVASLWEDHKRVQSEKMKMYIERDRHQMEKEADGIGVYSNSFMVFKSWILSSFLIYFWGLLNRCTAFLCIFLLAWWSAVESHLRISSFSEMNFALG